MLPPFTWLRPTSLDEAIQALSEDAVPYCGGTELLLAMRAGLYQPETLVDLKRVPGLDGIDVVDGALVIGGTARHMDIAAHPQVRQLLPMFADVEYRVGNPRVRAQGSIGGNLCFAEPKSDVTTALLALDAVLTLQGTAGERTTSMADFLGGPYYAVKEPDEVLTSIAIPVRRPHRAAYLKFQITERPTLGVAVVVDEPSGECRVAVGAVGEVPALWTFASIDEVDTDQIAAEVDPTPDLTGGVPYKRHLTAVFVRRTMARLAPGGGG